MNIVDFFVKINDLTTRNNLNLLRKFKFYSVIRLINSKIAIVVLEFYFYLTKNKTFNSLSYINPSCPVVLSLTTFPGRVSTMHLCLETILRQSIKPGKIIVYLSREQFPTLDLLPNKLFDMTRRGVTFELVSGDIKSHKKYFYVLNQYPETPIITIDDDLFYDSNLIKRLYESYLKNPKKVYSSYGYEMKFDKQDKLLPYRNWKMIKNSKDSSFFNFFGSGGGTLFPPKSFHFEVLNFDVIKNVAMNADDIWLNAMTRLNRYPVEQVTGLTIFNIPSRNKVTLSQKNLGENQNDIQLQKVSEFCKQSYDIDPFSFEFCNSN